MIGQPTCLAPDALEPLIPVPAQSPEYLVDPLPPAGMIPEGFRPTSVVVCEFLQYTGDNGAAIPQRAGLGHGDVYLFGRWGRDLLRRRSPHPHRRHLPHPREPLAKDRTTND